jgi:hypothetical protein
VPSCRYYLIWRGLYVCNLRDYCDYDCFEIISDGLCLHLAQTQRLGRTIKTAARQTGGGTVKRSDGLNTGYAIQKVGLQGGGPTQ